MTKQEIQELKASLSIREVIGRYTKLNRVGRRWMGLCPFHGDRHPSLSVNEEKGSFVCYACGERGDVFAFVGKIENVGFIEAANKLRVDNGNKLPIGDEQLAVKRKEEKEGQEEEKENSDAKQLSVVNSQSSIENEAFLALLLPAGSGCSELTPTWLDFGVGQSPCLVPGRWKAMRNRLVFPVRDEEGRLVGFAARRLSDEDGDKPKYINSETGGLYRKSELLYGLYEAREAIGREGSVFLVEGYKDVLAMHAAGFRHTVALCGTALCPGHIALLKRYTRSVRVMLDADKAGRKAADAIVPVLAGEGMEAVRIGLPEGDDPDSLFRRLGKEAFAAYGPRGGTAGTAFGRTGVARTHPERHRAVVRCGGSGEAGTPATGAGRLPGAAEGPVRRCLPPGDNGLEVGMTGAAGDEEGKWKSRSTTLRRLGRQYSPDVTPEVASRRLKQWIVGNPVLLGLLRENGWTASRRVLTPRQVEQIVRVLGEP